MGKCITPYIVKDKRGIDRIVPCSKCPPCVSRRASSWSFRLKEEEKISSSSYFITLTYNTDSIPITKEGFATLEKTDLQKYFKRLRKLSKQKIKYYAVGEYGTKTERPHYHIIMFNAKEKDIVTAWNLEDKTIGQIHIGDVSGASIGYTLKYLNKSNKLKYYQNDDRNKEFCIMSKGLGKSYISENIIKWHKADITNRMYVNLPGNKKVSMPRYYKELIYTESERKKIAWFQQLKYDEEERKLQTELGEDYNRIQAAKHLQEFKKHKKQKQSENIK